MSEQVPETPPDATQGPDVTQDTGNETPQETQQESKAPWSDYVQKFPTSFHPIAEEVFKEWDGNVTKRFQDLHSTYEPYKPFVEEWEPEAISQALGLAQALEADPEQFYKALAQSYGFAGEQGAANQQQEVAPPELDPDDPYAPQLQQHEELLRTLADHIIGQEQAKRQAEEAQHNEQVLDQTLASLKEKHGEYDEDFVINLIANGVHPDKAVQHFQQTVSQWAAKQNAPAANAPRVMGGGNGSIPSNQVDPATLGRKETKSLVEQYLNSAKGT